MHSEPAIEAGAVARAVPGSRPGAPSQRRAWITVVILSLLSIVSFVDRQVLALLVADVKRDMSLSDLEFGLLLGPAFIVTYNLMLFPLAWLVDRANRRILLLAGCILWSTATFLSAFATDFTHLIVLRSGVAIGEALLAPIAISLIGDLFAANRRPLATAIFVAGSTVGTTSATLFSAAAYQLVSGANVVFPPIGLMHTWRLTLIAVSVPGLLLGALFALVAVTPKRTAASIDRPQTSIYAHLRTHGLIYLLACITAGLLLLASTGINLWGPAYLMRRFAVSQVQAGYLLGGTSLVTAATGLIAFPLVARRLAQHRALSSVMVAMTCTALILSLPGLLVFGFGGSLTTCLIGGGTALLFLASATALPTQLIQIFTPAEFKGRITALVLFFMFLISIGIGPVLIPFVAEHYASGNGALGAALASTGTLVCTIAALCAFLLWKVLNSPASFSTAA